MIKDLVHDDAILSTPCEPATAEDAPVAQDLVDTLAAIDDAVCLAANQIGVTKAIIAFQDDKDEVHVMYNPKVLMGLGGAKVEENCLTHEEVTKVTRFASRTRRSPRSRALPRSRCPSTSSWTVSSRPVAATTSAGPPR